MKSRAHILHRAWFGAGRARSGRDTRESRLGRAGADPAEIPQVGGTKTRPGGVGTASAERAGTIYYVEIGPARVGRVPGEIFAKVGWGVRMPTRPRFLKSTGPKRNQAVLERYQYEDRGPYTTLSLAWRG